MAGANKYGGKDSWDDYDNNNTMDGGGRQVGLEEREANLAKTRGGHTKSGLIAREKMLRAAGKIKGEVYGAPGFKGPIIYGDPKTERMLRE